MFGAMLVGLFGMIPLVTLLLMFSFFVLVVTRKLDSRGFRVFGYVVTALLWVSIVITIVGGSITAMVRRSLMMSPQAQQARAASRFPAAPGAMQGRTRAQLPRQMTAPQAAQQQAQGQVTPTAQAQQPDAASPKNK